MKRKDLNHGMPLLRVKSRDLESAGVTRVPRVVGTRNGKPVLAGGEVVDVENIIWCTGFEPGFSWIDLPVFNADGTPNQSKGVVEDVLGLFFVGLHFQYAVSSAMVQGVGRDGERIARVIAARRLAVDAAVAR